MAEGASGDRCSNAREQRAALQEPRERRRLEVRSCSGLDSCVHREERAGVVLSAGDRSGGRTWFPR